jgi:hypothetical protein
MVVRLYSPSINLVTFSNIIPVQDKEREEDGYEQTRFISFI